MRVDLFGFTEGDTVTFSLDEDGTDTASGLGGGFGTFSTSVGRADLAQPMIGGTTIGPGGTGSTMLTIPASTTPGAYTLSVLIGSIPVASTSLVVLAALPGSLVNAGSELARGLVIALALLVAGGYFWYRRRESTQQFA